MNFELLIKSAENAINLIDDSKIKFSKFKELEADLEWFKEKGERWSIDSLKMKVGEFVIICMHYT